MERLNHALEPHRWAVIDFGEAPMGDCRRAQRLQTIGEAMAANPGASIPQLFAHPYDVKATYTFFAHPEVDADRVGSVHRTWVHEQLEEPGRYLLIEDTTELDWSGRSPIKGLGLIGNHRAGAQGLKLQSVLAARWEADAPADDNGRRPALELLGVVDQQYYRRVPRPKGEKKGASQARKQRQRESQRWWRTSERLGAAPGEARWVRVADAEADIYELLLSCQAQGHGYVIRAGQDRALVGAEGCAAVGRLYGTLRAAPSLGTFDVKLTSRAGQAARTAHLDVSAQAVRLRSPQRPGRSVGKGPAIACTAVRVWEADAPVGVEALEWMLLCDAPVQSFAQAQQCALQYASRWLVEEFHKALKSGLGVERLQLADGERLKPAAAIMSIVALRLVGLREQVRLTPQRPADEAGLEPLALQVLRQATERMLRTVEEVALALGRLGGHLNRRQDGLPGWHTLWRGMRQLDLLVQGVRLSRKLPGFG